MQSVSTQGGVRGQLLSSVRSIICQFYGHNRLKPSKRPTVVTGGGVEDELLVRREG